MKRLERSLWVAALASACVGPAPLGVAGPEEGGRLALTRVDPSELAVTSGGLTPEGVGRFTVRSPSFRAELGRSPRAGAEVAFVYQGPTPRDARLASGELRRQIGLKLRAQDSCNVLYVMWHIEPTPRVSVSIKSNPGQHRHVECRDGGYRPLEPAIARTTAPVIREGESHILAASIRGRELMVTTDGHAAWQGELPAAAFAFDGPIGVRSDSGQFSIALRAEAPVAP